MYERPTHLANKVDDAYLVYAQANAPFFRHVAVEASVKAAGHIGNGVTVSCCTLQ